MLYPACKRKRDFGRVFCCPFTDASGINMMSCTASCCGGDRHGEERDGAASEKRLALSLRAQEGMV